MPRTGGVYSPPAGTKGTSGTTIQSSRYNALVDDLTADANAARPITAGGTGSTNATAARTALGLTPGTDVQAYDALLQAIAGLTTAANQIIYTTAPDAVAVTSITTYGRSLIDDADAAAARTTLGLGSLATLGSVNDANWSGADLSIANGGTGASTAAAARTSLGLATVAATGNITDLTGTLPNARVSGSYDGIVNLSITGALSITNSAPSIVMSDTTAGSYNTRIIVDSNNWYLQKQADGSTSWSTFMQFEMDTTNAYANGSQIWTQANHPHVNLGTTAATARTALGLGDLATTNLSGLVYNGSSTSNTNFPIGTTITFSGSRYDRNEVVTVRLGTDANTSYWDNGTGAVLAGTWRAHGRTSSGESLARRTA